MFLKRKNIRKPTFIEVLILLTIMIMIIYGPIIMLGTDAHVTLFIIIVISALFAMFLGHPWEDIQEAILDGIKSGLSPILILFLIGMVISGWIAGGIVPYIIYLGLLVFS